jgi:hypothetical protein
MAAAPQAPQKSIPQQNQPHRKQGMPQNQVCPRPVIGCKAQWAVDLKSMPENHIKQISLVEWLDWQTM